MDLSRRALLIAAASAARGLRAAETPRLACPLTAEPAVLIPGVSNALGTRLVGGQIYRGLLRWGPEGALEPDLATGIAVSADGLRYAIGLRSDVTWHDSGGFTSADVAFSLRRFHSALQPGLGLGRMAVDTPGPWAVVLTLPAAAPLLLRRLTAVSLPIVPAHVHDRAGWGLDPKATAPVGTGPYRMDGWLRLVRFDWYAGPKPSLAAVDFPILPDAAARTALLEGPGVVLLVGDAVDMASVPHLRTLPGLVVEGQYPPFARSIAGLRLNATAPPLDQAGVRLALACAIDRVAALRDGWSGLGQVAGGPWLGGRGQDGAPAVPAYDLRRAADLLRQAGMRPDDTGIRARLTCIHPPDPAWPAMLAGVKRSMALTGVALTVVALPYAEWRRRLAAGEYELSAFAVERGDDEAGDLAGDATFSTLPLVEPAVPVAHPARLKLPYGAFGSFERASLA